MAEFKSCRDLKEEAFYQSQEEDKGLAPELNPELIQEQVSISNKRELSMSKEKKIREILQKLALELKESKELEFTKELVENFPEVGVFLVGGSIRDAILEKKPKDIDLVINYVPFSDLVDILSGYGRIVFDLAPKVDITKLSSQEREKIIQKGFGVLKFFPKGKGQSIDIAFPRTDNYKERAEILIEGVKRDVFAQADPNLNIKEDLKRRDFTVNALALDILNGRIIDNFEGIEDIISKKIKAVGDPKQRILKEDLSRAFRGLRFSVQLGFEIEEKSRQAIEKAFSPASKSTLEVYKKEKKEIVEKLIAKEKKVRKEFQIKEDKNLPLCLQIFYDYRTETAKTAVAPEVISEEFLKSLKADCLKTIELWEEIGALKIIFPEIEKMKKIPQPPEFHSEGDVYRHTLLALEKLPKDADIRLKLAVLFHDIGKPVTLKTPEKDKVDRIRFNEHAETGAAITEKALRRLKMPKDIIAPVVWTIKYHLLGLTSEVKKLKHSTIEKYFFREDNWGELLLDLIKYDSWASIPKSGNPDLSDYDELKKRISDLEKLKKEKDKLPKPLLNGNDLIKLGFTPGKIFKEILDKLRDLQLEEKVKTKPQAQKKVLNLFKRYLSKK